MKISRQPDAKKLLLAFAAMAALSLLSDVGIAQVTMPRMREMATMQDHHSHPQQRETTPRLSADDETQTFTFTAIDVPTATGTLATGVNARGQIVGIYYDSAGNSHGFLFKSGGFFTVDAPGSLVGVSGTLQTEANGMLRRERLVHPPALRRLHPFHRNAGAAFCTARVNSRMCWSLAKQVRFRTPSPPMGRSTAAITTMTTLLRWSVLAGAASIPTSR